MSISDCGYRKPERIRIAASSLSEIRYPVSEIDSPFHHRARPGEAAAEDDHQHVIAPLNPAAPVCFIEGHGDRGRRGVAVLVEVHVETIERNLQAIRDRFD